MSDTNSSPKSSTPLLVFAWLAVLLPLLWGTALTLEKALALFR